MSLTPELRDAVNHIRSHAEGMRAVLTLADAVGEIEKLEAAANEAEVRKSSASKSADESAGRLADLERRVAEQHTALIEAQSKASSIIAKATAAAADIEKTAQAEADAIIAKATAGIDDQVVAAKAALADLDAMIAGRQSALASLDATIAERGQAVADIDARVARARDFLSSLAEKA